MKDIKDSTNREMYHDLGVKNHYSENDSTTQSNL